MPDSLSHSCPTCDGKGVLGGCGRDDCDHAHTLMFCNDCNPQPPMTAELAPPYPLMSEGGDWYAFPKSMTKREVVSEIIHNYADWWLDEHIWHDDNDRPHGWVSAIRSLFGAVSASRLRPSKPDEYGYPDWWYEDDSGPVECWVVRL